MATTASTNGEASSAFQAALAAAGIQNDSLSDIARLQLAVANLITNPVFAGPATISGAVTLGSTVAITGAATATGGLNLATEPTVVFAAGGPWALATTGTDTACSNGVSYFVELNIPYNRTVTGLAYQVGSVGGTDKVIAVLYNSAGAVVANSATAGATVGTAAQLQSVDFLTPYAAVSGRYFASVTFNGTTAKFRSYPIPGSLFIAGSEAETFGTVTAITPGTTFTADKGPLCFAY